MGRKLMLFLLSRLYNIARKRFAKPCRGQVLDPSPTQHQKANVLEHDIWRKLFCNADVIRNTSLDWILNQQVIRGDPLQWTSVASESLCLGDNAEMASTSKFTMYFRFWESVFIFSSDETSTIGLNASFCSWDIMAWASATTDGLSSVAYRIFFIAATTCREKTIYHRLALCNSQFNNTICF